MATCNPATANRILANLPRAEAASIVAAGRVVELDDGTVLHEPGQRICQVHFPIDCVLSLRTLLENGDSIEAATVGREGMSGLPVFLGSAQATTRAVVTTTGRALEVSSGHFRQLMKRSPNLCCVTGRYAELLFMQSAQLLACERAHTVRQRCARWLLTTSDQSGCDAIKTSQAALAHVLGVRRASVTNALKDLARLGLVRMRRGVICITRRRALTDEACECYRTIGEILV